jgi:hypothetical protein
VTNLCRFVGKFDLDFTAFGTEPQENLITVVQNHDIVISKIILNENPRLKKIFHLEQCGKYLAEVGAFFRNGEISFLVGASEEPCVLEEVRS